MDILNELLISSDPIILSINDLPTKKSGSFTQTIIMSLLPTVSQ